MPLVAEDEHVSGTAHGEWRYWSGDERSSRYSPLDQINADNFEGLEVAWRWQAANYGPSVDYIYRATPIYVKGKRSHATILTTKSLLIYGEGRSSAPLLHAVDKASGEEIARVEIPAPTNTAPMTYIHNGKQYIVLSVAGKGMPAEHVALTLAEE
ncbi:MAG: hypothetical protein BMS9Abin37_2694 [Acidobacteriota bacterium]|nr:MAG: hypothetical protein BMS9Abin37_2694 [Acidobacteriota bacterium]